MTMLRSQNGVNVEVFGNVDLAGMPAITRIDSHINQGAPLDFVPLAIGEFDRSAFAPAGPVSMRWTGFHTPAVAGMHDVFVQFGGFGRDVGHRLYIDVQAKKWRADAGTFGVLVGSSSAQIEARGEVVVGAATR
jgi:hypothetical protein